MEDKQIGHGFIDRDYVVRNLTEEQVNELILKEDPTIIDRMVFVETRATGKVKSGIFPGFIEHMSIGKDGRTYWQIVLTQRVGGRFGMAAMRIFAEDLGVKYRIWDKCPTAFMLKRSGELKPKEEEEQPPKFVTRDEETRPKAAGAAADGDIQ